MNHSRVYCLYRVSLNKQVDQISHDGKVIADIPMQKTACRKYCAAKGWEIAGEYQEAGVSGYKNSAYQRAAVQEIISAAHKKLFNILLVYTIDRLSRRDSELPMLLEEITKCGISVWSVEDGEIRYSTSTDRLLAYLYGWKANGESERISQRITTIQRQMVAKGEYRGGAVPYGYKLIETGERSKQGRLKRVLAVHEPEAAVIRMIFDRIAAGNCSMYQLTRELTAMPVPDNTRPMTWRSASLHVILRNQIYIGRQRFKDELSLPFAHLQIVDPPVFQKVQTLTAQKKRSDKQRTAISAPPHYHDIVYCGHCGSHLVYNHACQYRKDGSPIIRYLYRCYNKERFANPCDGACTYSARIVDEKVLQYTQRLVATINSIDDESLLTNAISQTRTELLVTVDTLRQQLQELDAQFSSVRQGISAGLEQYGLSATSTLQLLYEDLRTQRNCIQLELQHSQRLLADADFLWRQKRKELIALRKLCHTPDNAIELQIAGIFSRILIRKEYQIAYQLQPSVQQFLVIDADTSPGD